MNITVSFNAGDLTQLASSVQRLTGDIRCGHVVKTGAVLIYRGGGAVSHDRTVRRFAGAHITTEQDYLDLPEMLLPDDRVTTLRAALCLRQQDEVHHRDEERTFYQSADNGLLRLWVWAVGAGSKVAVSASRPA